MDLTTAGAGFIRTAGVMLLKVTKYTKRATDSGSEWHDYSLQNVAGEETKVSISASEKALFILASFAKACGITEEKALKKFQPTDCVGKKVQIAVIPTVSKGKTFHQGATLHWWAEGVAVPEGALPAAIDDYRSQLSQRGGQTAAAPVFATPPFPDPDDQIPFGPDADGNPAGKQW